MSKIQLQVGKRYVDRRGKVTGHLHDYSQRSTIYPFRCPLLQSIYTPTGDFHEGSGEHQCDLVSEYTEPSGGMATYIPPKERLQPFDNQVDDVLAMVGDMLKSKNKAYGNSALDPIRVFAKSDAIEQLNVRIDDKLSRIMRGTDSGEDVDLDLIGYLVIRRIAKGGAL